MLSRKLQKQGFHNCVWSEYSDALLPTVAWPGGYTLVYYIQTGQGDTYLVCGDCARIIAYQSDDAVVDMETYDEGPVLRCEQCGRPVASSYGDPDLADEIGEAAADHVHSIECEVEAAWVRGHPVIDTPYIVGERIRA